MKFVHHRAEMSILGEIYDGVREGRGRVALVGGPVASGKTTLLGRLADRALESGAVVLQAIATEPERTLPYGVVGQLLQSPAVSAELAEEFAGLLDAGESTPVEDRAAVLQQTARTIAAALVKLSRTAPLLLVVDDLHHADDESLHCLLFLLLRIRAARIMVALGERTSDRSAGPAFHAELVRLPHCRRIRLATLPADGVVDLITGELGADAARLLAPGCHELTGGNLLLVHALLEDHRSAGGPAEPVPGFAFRDAVLSCLRSSGPAALDVAAAVAVLGGAVDAARAAELLGAPADETVRSLGDLEAAGILAAGRFRHAAAAAAVLEAVEPGRRAELRRRAARLRYDEGADSTTVAEMLVAAEDLDEPWAVTVLRTAAERALAEDDVEKVVRYLEPVSRRGDTAQRVAVTTLLADAEWRVSPVAAERRVRALAADLGETGTEPGPLRHLLWHGGADEASRAFARFAGEGGLSLDAEALCLAAACTHPALAARLPAPARPAGTRPVPSGTVVDTQWRAARILRGVLRGRHGDNVVVAVEQILQSTRLADATIQPLTFALRALMYAGSTERALPWCERLLEEASKRRAPAWQAVFSALRAEIAVRQGGLPAAREHAAKALSLISAPSWGVAIGSPLASLIRVHTETGAHDEAEALLAQPVPDAMLRTVYALPYLYARGRHQLATDQVYAALREFMAVGELMSAWGIDIPSLVPWRLGCAEAYLRIGDRPKAAELVDGQLNLVSESNAAALGATLRVLANTHELADRPPMLKKAVDEIQAGGDRLELAKALADLGRTHHELNETSRARMMVRRAWHVAKDCQAEAVCGELLPHLSAEDMKPVAAEAGEAQRLASLTSAEYRTAALARHGYTNREIARKLFITVSTVEQHLTRTYRKLKVGNRADLPAGLEPTIAGTA
ncbi:AAA family ATPase [Amycolatopsis sp. cmx-4-68]|uniref:helix-turn-helix transcriptional regulator n=1 Tax=Amycolatopsis sp. cmx-4-68 TaxID=2790938 RepID=UPI00397917F7